MTALPDDLTRNEFAPQVFASVPSGASGLGSRAIYIVVPVHNRKVLTERFLECLSTQTFRNFTTIVVDDGSADGTSELIRDRFPDVILLHGDGNLWWSGATNLGIRRALADATDDDAILIINDDLEVDPWYLSRLHAVWLSNPGTLIGSVVVDIDDPDRILYGGETRDRWFAKSRWLNTGRRLSEFGSDHRVEVSVLNGMGTLVPVSAFRKIGLYDEKHFQQGGDDELSARAGNKGYALMMTYGAVVKAHPETTAGINVQRAYSIGDVKSFFFGIKSYYRLQYRFFYAYNVSRNPFAFCSFLICDIARITFHFASRVRL